jgi:hypothetical protein
MRHPWRFYPASTGQFTAASKGGRKPKAATLAKLSNKPSFGEYVAEQAN